MSLLLLSWLELDINLKIDLQILQTIVLRGSDATHPSRTLSTKEVIFVPTITISLILSIPTFMMELGELYSLIYQSA